MKEQRPPVTIDQVQESEEATVSPQPNESAPQRHTSEVACQSNGTHSDKQHTKSRYNIQDSASRIKHIAHLHYIDAPLQDEKTKKSAFERAIEREKKLRERRQKNLERIIQLSHQSCQNETAGEPDQDWLYRFFEMAQDIHNASMQRLWAQVLKREVTNPGATSMKALKVLKDMTPREAQVLQKAAALACTFGNDHNRKLLVGLRVHQQGFFNLGKREHMMTLSLGNFQLPYSSLLLLIELGLLHGTELESGEIEQSPPLSLHYQGKNLLLQAHSRGIRLLYYRFSPTGNELCTLLGHKINQSYYDQLIAVLHQKFTIQIESSISRSV